MWNVAAVDTLLSCLDCCYGLNRWMAVWWLLLFMWSKLRVFVDSLCMDAPLIISCRYLERVVFNSVFYYGCS